MTIKEAQKKVETALQIEIANKERRRLAAINFLYYLGATSLKNPLSPAIAAEETTTFKKPLFSNKVHGEWAVLEIDRSGRERVVVSMPSGVTLSIVSIAPGEDEKKGFEVQWNQSMGEIPIEHKMQIFDGKDNFPMDGFSGLKARAVDTPVERITAVVTSAKDRLQTYRVLDELAEMVSEAELVGLLGGFSGEKFTEKLLTIAEP